MKNRFHWVFRIAILIIGMISAITDNCEAGTWTPLNNQPSISVNAPLLLTDGSVVVEVLDPSTYLATGAIWKLTPNINGSYVNGTWTQLASLPAGYAPLYHASAVLADGRLIYEGGEYNGQNSNQVHTNQGAIYDPVLNQWTSVAPPPFFPNPSTLANPSTGDAASVVLFDGTFMLQCSGTSQAALLDLATMTWTETGTSTKADNNDEEGWTLLPNNTVLTIDCGVPPPPYPALVPSPPPPTNTEVYNPQTGTWTFAGNTPETLTDQVVFEMGPAVLRPDGTVLAFGGNATGNTAIYDTVHGTWSAGPSIPTVSGMQPTCEDAPAALLPNGNVLVVASPYGVPGPVMPLSIFEVDLNNNFHLQQPTISNGQFDATFFINLLILPTGQILLTSQSQDVQIYTPSDTTHNPAWEPTITSAPAYVFSGCPNYRIDGILFNGMSQGAMYGDEYQSATNYPLVRITNLSTGHVFYCRTHDHSGMYVAATTTPVHTFFDVPSNIESGESMLEVVANGIPSTPIFIIVNPQPVATATPPAQTICSGATTNIDLSSNIEGTTFSWTVLQVNVTGATPGSGATIDQTLTATLNTPGAAIYTITPSVSGCMGSPTIVGMPITVIITVNPQPVAMVTPSTQTICNGTTTNIALSSNVVGTTFSWTVSEVNVTGATSGSGKTIAQTLTATSTTSSGTATYTITPSANGCTGNPITAIITVNPQPVAMATPSTQTICNGTTTNIALSSNVVGTTFSWTVSEVNVTGATSGSGTTIAQTLTATSTTSGTATYTITPSANGCTGNPIIVTVTVKLCPPKAPKDFQGKIKKNEFATQEDLIHDLSWSASTDSNVVGYRLYQDGKLIKILSIKEPTKVTLHNRFPDKRYTYSLVAFNVEGVESKPLKLTLPKKKESRMRRSSYKMSIEGIINRSNVYSTSI